MNHIKLKAAHLENFKGISSLDVQFSNKTLVSGRNASGKTTIVDSVFWTLFDKDSQGNSKFEIRPLDESGQKIHHIEISSTLLLDVDGVEYELKKTQKEKWVKKRGQEEQEFSGNQNFYEINGFPKSEKEYKEFISSIVDESIFKLLTNPMAFSALDWKKQREILMRFVEDVSPAEIEAAVDDFNLIASDIAVASIDDCKKKYSKSVKAYKDRQKEIPVRIDELNGQKVTIDLDAIEKQRAALQSEIDTAENEVRDNAVGSIGALNQRIAELENRERQLVEDANAERKSKLNAVMNKLRDMESEREMKLRELNRVKDAIGDALADKNNSMEDYENLKQQFALLKEKTFDESKNVCPTCGQALPEDRQEENRQSFEDWKESEKQRINLEGKDAITRHKQSEKAIADNEAKLKELNKVIAELTQNVSALEKQAEPLRHPVDVSDSDEQKRITQDILLVKHKIAQHDSLEAERQRKLTEIRQMKESLRALDTQIASASINDNLDARIAELRTELKETGQKLADSERLIYILENYTKFLAQKINERFDGLEFKLFETQINSGVRECCEVRYNGVPYGSLNSGHRIVVGLEIIKTLQNLYGVAAPVFVDNAETINAFNLPEMDCQMVCLKVNDNEKLIIT